MLKVITKHQYPDVWTELLEYAIDETYHEYRRNSNYYTVKILKFDKDNLPDHPELHGLWETDTFVWDHEYGGNLPNECYRVKRKEQTIQEIYYERV